MNVYNDGECFIVHGEIPGPWSAAGATIILATTALYALRRSATR